MFDRELGSKGRGTDGETSLTVHCLKVKHRGSPGPEEGLKCLAPVKVPWRENNIVISLHPGGIMPPFLIPNGDSWLTRVLKAENHGSPEIL